MARDCSLKWPDCLEAGLIGKAFPAMTTLMCLRFLLPFFLEMFGVGQMLTRQFTLANNVLKWKKWQKTSKWT